MATKTYTLFINSAIDRQSIDTTTHNWTTYLSRSIKTNSGQIKLKLLDIELPNLAYNFGPYAYKLWYIKDVGGADTLTSISLPITENIANGTALVAKLNALFTANSDSLVASIGSTTNKITITNNDALLVYRVVSSYRWGDTTTTDDCTDRLGFTQDLRTTTLTAGGGTLTAESCIKLLRTNCYYLTCDILGSSVKQANIPQPYKNPNILAKVAGLNYGLLSQLQYSNDIYYDIGNKQIDMMRFELLDDNFDSIDCSNAAITFTLEISVI